MRFIKHVYAVLYSPYTTAVLIILQFILTLLTFYKLHLVLHILVPLGQYFS